MAKTPIKPSKTKERAVKASFWWRRNRHKIAPQWVRTVLVAFVWIGCSQYYALMIAPPTMWGQATYSTAMVVAASAIILTLFPPLTSAWRTLAWEAIVGALGGLLLLSFGVGEASLPLALGAMLLLLVARANHNVRRVWMILRTGRA